MDVSKIYIHENTKMKYQYQVRKDMSREIPSYLLTTERKIYYFYVTVENTPELVERIMEYLEAYDIDAPYGLISTHKNTRNIGLFVDFSRAKISIEECISYLRKMTGVIEVNYSNPIEDKIIFADIGFPITTLGGKERAVIFTESWFSMILDHIYNKFNTVGLVFLYEAGRGIGLDLGKEYKKFFSSFRNGFIALLKLLKSLGLADPININVYRDRIVVSFRDDFEANILFNKVKKENFLNNFNRGILEGFIEGFIGERYKSRQILFDKRNNVLTIVIAKD